MKMERNSLKVLGIFLLIASLFVTNVAFAAQGFPVGSIAYVCADTKLNLRLEPQGQIIGDIARGETVTILGEIDRNGYYKIRVNRTGQECYAYGEYLSLTNPNGSSSSTQSKPSTNVTPDVPEYEDGVYAVVVSDRKLNLRKKASKKADRIKYLEDGDILLIHSFTVDNNYILVEDVSDGTVGYVDINFIRIDVGTIDEDCECTHCPIHCPE